MKDTGLKQKDFWLPIDLLNQKEYIMLHFSKQIKDQLKKFLNRLYICLSSWFQIFLYPNLTLIKWWCLPPNYHNNNKCLLICLLCLLREGSHLCLFKINNKKICLLLQIKIIYLKFLNLICSLLLYHNKIINKINNNLNKAIIKINNKYNNLPQFLKIESINIWDLLNI